MPDPRTLIVERRAGGVVLIRLNHPERRNALATPLLRSLADAMNAADADEDVRVVVITGSDTLFAAGADIDELLASGDDDDIETPRYIAWAAIRSFSKPLVAAVEGWCLGAGAELMMSADIVVAAKGAKIGQPETNLGIIPGAGGTATLPRRIGRARAMHMVLTGDLIDADEAHAIGLIACLAEQGQALADALALAAKLAMRAPLAMRAAKASIRDAEFLDEADHLRAERVRFIKLLGTADKAEGIAAFKERRAPNWQGK